MTRTTANSQAAGAGYTGVQHSPPPPPPPHQVGNVINEGQSSSSVAQVPISISLTESQFSSLLGSLNVREGSRSTFSSCNARFGGSNSSKVEDFIETIIVYKNAVSISDHFALTSFPLLLDGYASSWWQGVKHEAKSFDEAIELLRTAFSPPRPDWRIFAEILQDKQKITETTDSFICRKRRLFSQLKKTFPEQTIIDLLFSQISLRIRERLSREDFQTFQDLLNRAREIELSLNENQMSTKPHPVDVPEKSTSSIRCSFCRKKNHSAEVLRSSKKKEK
ncbi:activity-regulated cytoskeleton associated protein 2-like [Episyrphus balteatus]|uniref:activity-regulated cytoskeleton associated protein 2-like n=1 Tax=Episyrphus balteatus TaxID=286459 RepID=UPI002486443B|nr:activity-regulated cytoskeleton associated protein 2-like [Episyrphus balteatus]